MTLRLFLAMAVAVALLVAPAAIAKEKTWKGEVVDLSCYLAKGLKGPGHKKCAQMCAAQGQPVGLLTDAGELYLLVGPHDGTALDDAKKLCGSAVELTGSVLERDGLRAIEVQSVKESGG